MFFIPQLIVFVGKEDSFDLTMSRNKKIMLKEQGTTDASLIVVKFDNF